MNATAEDRRGGPAHAPADTYRASVRSMFRDLAEAAGAADPDHLASQLALLYDGAMVAARMDRNPETAATAREIASALLDAATGPGARATGRAKKSNKAQATPARRRRA
jgi:hypothetical protein